MNQLFSLLFVPHEKNNHRALLLQPGFLGILICLYLLNQSLVRSFTIARPGVLGYSSEITAQKVIDLTNQQRQKLGLTPLKLNSKLNESAAAKARDMFAQNYWAHNSPNGSTPWQFFKTAGYEYSVAGENLARDFYDTDSMIKAWMKSPTHRANIINTKYQEIGIGVVNGTLEGIKTTLVVQHFGTPLIQTAVIPDSADTLVPVADPVLSSTDLVLPQTSSQPRISPLTISKIFGGLMFVLIITVLFIDGFVSLRRKTRRLTGSSASHIGFLVIILIFMLFSHSGSIF